MRRWGDPNEKQGLKKVQKLINRTGGLLFGTGENFEYLFMSKQIVLASSNILSLKDADKS